MRRRNVEEVLGTRSVPDLCFHFLIAVGKIDGTEQEFDSVSLLRTRIVVVLGDPEQEVGLSDSLIADDNDLVKVVECLGWIVQRIGHC